MSHTIVLTFANPVGPGLSTCPIRVSGATTKQALALAGQIARGECSVFVEEYAETITVTEVKP